MTEEQKKKIIEAWNSAQSRNRTAQKRLHTLEKVGIDTYAMEIQMKNILCAGSELIGMQAILSALGIEIEKDNHGYALSIKEVLTHDPA